MNGGNLDLLSVVTVRMDSERRNGKVMATVGGKPLLYWILKRLEPLQSRVVVAITHHHLDDQIEIFATKLGYPVIRHQAGDLVGTMAAAMDLYPEEKFVQRVLGDCPFLETTLVERAIEVLSITGAEVFLWHQAPHLWPVYGAREFPYRRSAWEKIIAGAKGDELEHPDLYFNRNRRQFDIVYHHPPGDVYYRHPQRMRLEVDYPDDIVMIEHVAQAVGMLAPLRDVVQYLDKADRVRTINASCVEKTGPAISYSYTDQRNWAQLMASQPFYTWANEWIKPMTKGGDPVYCLCGYKLGDTSNGYFYQSASLLMGVGVVLCPACGTPRVWSANKKKAG